MSWIAVAGVAVTAVGSAVSAKGAADSAAAIGAANKANAEAEQELYNRQQKAANKLSNNKMDKLSNLGNIFDRMESTGAFGSGDTLKNLRQAQSDYSALAAGDFSGFENQLKQSLSDSLIATAGAGAPIGTFAGLAAQDQMNLRNQGIQTTMGISEYLSKEAYQLLGNEFGIMDQKFEVGYKLDRDKVTNMSNYALGQAATEGVAMTAYGNAGQQIGSSIIGAYNNYQNRETIQKSNANQLKMAEMAYSRQSGITPQTINPVTGMPLGTEGALAAFRASLNTGGSNLNAISNNVNSVGSGSNVPDPGNFNYNTFPTVPGEVPPNTNRAGGVTIMTPGGNSDYPDGIPTVGNPVDNQTLFSYPQTPNYTPNYSNMWNSYSGGLSALAYIGSSMAGR